MGAWDSSFRGARSGSVRLRFGGGTVRAVPGFGSGGSPAKRVSRASVQFNRKAQFRFLENSSGGGSGSAFGFGSNGSDGPVSGSGSVLFSLHPLQKITKLETVAATRVAAINPPINDTDLIRKFSIDPGIHMN